MSPSTNEVLDGIMDDSGTGSSVIASDTGSLCC